MATFKVRRLLTAQGGIKVGPSGGSVTEILFGTAEITAPSLATATEASANVAVTGVVATDTLVATVSTSSSVLRVKAIKPGAGVITASFVNTSGCSSSATTASVQYIVLN